MESYLDPNERLWRTIQERGLDPESPGATEALAFLGRGERLLDAGCGSGKAAAGAVDRFDLAVGLDVSPTALALSASRGLVPVRADLARGFAPFADASFDAVACLDAIEHLPDPSLVFPEIHRVLRPGGRLVLTTVNIRYAGHLLSLIRGVFPRTADLSTLGPDASSFSEGHLSFFTRVSLENALRAAGFEAIHCEGRQPAIPPPFSRRPIRALLPASWRRDLFCRGLIAVADRPRDPSPRPARARPVEKTAASARTSAETPGAGPMAGGRPGLSLVIVSWNTRAELSRCLDEAIRAATAVVPGGVETIVVDNGSLDGSPEAVRASHPEARLIRNRFNLGFGRAANQGIRLASAPLVLLLNPDVRIDAKTLGALIEAVESHPTLGAVGPILTDSEGIVGMSYLHLPGPRVLLRWFLGRRGLSRLAGSVRLSEPPPEAVADVDALLGGCMLVRAEALGSAGVFDERFFLYAEDLDLCVRLRQRGSRVALVRGAVAIHDSGRAASLDPDRARQEWIRSHRLFYRKHGLGTARIAFEILVALDRLFSGFGRRGLH